MNILRKSWIIIREIFFQKQKKGNFLILIIAGASADASADESSDKFLKKTVFFTLFLIFLNSRPIQSLSKARSDPYWEEQSLQKINQSNTVFKQFLNSFFCHSLNCFDSFKYSSAPACIFILYGQMISSSPLEKQRFGHGPLGP